MLSRLWHAFSVCQYTHIYVLPKKWLKSFLFHLPKWCPGCRDPIGTACPNQRFFSFWNSWPQVMVSARLMQARSRNLRPRTRPQREPRRGRVCRERTPNPCHHPFNRNGLWCRPRNRRGQRGGRPASVLPRLTAPWLGPKPGWPSRGRSGRGLYLPESCHPPQVSRLAVQVRFGGGNWLGNAAGRPDPMEEGGPHGGGRTPSPGACARGVKGCGPCLNPHRHCDLFNSYVVLQPPYGFTSRVLCTTPRHRYSAFE